MTGNQIRAARALLGMSATELAEKSKLGLATIRRAEAIDGEVRMIAVTEDALRRTLEAAGVEFIEPNGGGEGVRRKVRRA